MKKHTQEEFELFMESLVHQRLTVKLMKDAINEFLGRNNNNKISLYFKKNIIDDMWCGSTIGKDDEDVNGLYLDFDIYILPTNEKHKEMIIYYITEVSVNEG